MMGGDKSKQVQDVHQRTGHAWHFATAFTGKKSGGRYPVSGSAGHWLDGRSAKLVAESWFAAKDRPELDGLPEMVRVTLGRRANTSTAFHHSTCLLSLERKRRITLVSMRTRSLVLQKSHS